MGNPTLWRYIYIEITLVSWKNLHLAALQWNIMSCTHNMAHLWHILFCRLVSICTNTWSVIILFWNINLLHYLTYYHRVSEYSDYILIRHFESPEMLKWKFFHQPDIWSCWINVWFGEGYPQLLRNDNPLFISCQISNTHYTPAQPSWRGGILDSPCPSVCPSVRLSVRPSVCL